MSAEKRFIKALRAETDAVRALMQAMTSPDFEDRQDELEQAYRRAVEERRAALRVLEER